MKRRTERVYGAACITAALLCPLLPLHAYFAANWYTVWHSYSLGMLFGILSYCYFAVTLLIAARIRFLDRLFGHDRVMVLHGYLAVAALACAAAHAAFKLASMGAASMVAPHILLGIAAALVFALVALVTLVFMIRSVLHRIAWIGRMRSAVQSWWPGDYSRLKLFHNLTALTMACAVAHMLMAASTAENYWRLGLMGGTGAVALAAYLYHKVIRFALCYRRALRVSAVRPLSDTVVQLRARPSHGALPAFRAGQFGYIRLLSPQCGIEEHPFTVSSPPAAPELAITVKALGDYTARLTSLRSGCSMLFDGPYGRFWPRPDTERLLCLAGGIGITPFLSIAGEWEHSGVPCPATLIWSVRTREELIDEGLFERVAARHELFTCVPVITGLPGAGRIDSRLLSAHLDSSALCGTAVYICGPDAMRRALSGMLRTLGIPRSAIHYEDFSA